MDLDSWIEMICKNEAPPTSIDAYHFGLYESGNGYSIYLIGSMFYDAIDDDWATYNDFTTSSDHLQLSSRDFSDLTWEEVLEKVKFKLNEFVGTELFKRSFFFSAKAITLGFDDGDLSVVFSQ